MYFVVVCSVGRKSEGAELAKGQVSSSSRGSYGQKETEGKLADVISALGLVRLIGVQFPRRY